MGGVHRSVREIEGHLCHRHRARAAVVPVTVASYGTGGRAHKRICDACANMRPSLAGLAGRSAHWGFPSHPSRRAVYPVSMSSHEQEPELASPQFKVPGCSPHGLLSIGKSFKVEGGRLKRLPGSGDQRLAKRARTPGSTSAPAPTPTSDPSAAAASECRRRAAAARRAQHRPGLFPPSSTCRCRSLSLCALPCALRSACPSHRPLA